MTARPAKTNRLALANRVDAWSLAMFLVALVGLTIGAFVVWQEKER